MGMASIEDEPCLSKTRIRNVLLQLCLCQRVVWMYIETTTIVFSPSFENLQLAAFAFDENKAHTTVRPRAAAVHIRNLWRWDVLKIRDPFVVRTFMERCLQVRSQ